ncbi:YciI family protein [Commensalibacter oyaizuii]|uniref:YciI family protein n=1 Tax=Commensalibacter oyaizuii TaxID=3043873 RepID=A0ABT6Q019_9PROT|nr:YciI family protein [Commensalibacter sp. TBRC 16381]MDI2089834.1 YciI family protein [Commensalibacter sp. TBRC 16381]
MLFAVMCTDKLGCFETRMAVRPEHLVYLKKYESHIKICGPLSNHDGKSCGSLIIIDMENQSAVEQFAQNDPYAKAGVFESVIIRPFRMIGYEGKMLET